MSLYDILGSFRTLGLADILDMVIVASLIYVVLRWFKRTKAAFVATGMLIVATLYFLAREVVHMDLTTRIFERFFAVFIIALVVIFQEELRSFFERLAVWSLRRQRGVSTLMPKDADLLVHALGHFSREQIGALIVLKGRDPLERHIDGGFDLDGEISEPLLKSLFDPHSEGHDGAVIIERDRLMRFGAHLPLSKEFQKLAGLGTRHTAALGLSERTDALCLVVSEEKGIISIARDGHIYAVPDLPMLEEQIASFMRQKYPPPAEMRWPGFINVLRNNLPDKMIALMLSMALWLVFAQGFRPMSQMLQVPVVVRDLPVNLDVETIRPQWVRVHLEGLKRDFRSLNRANLRVFVELEDAEAGARRVVITDKHLRIPSELRVVSVAPSVVEVQLLDAKRRRRLLPERRE